MPRGFNSQKALQKIVTKRANFNKAKKFGDDEDRTIIKSDGALTYFYDVAYHRDKLGLELKESD